MFSKTYGVRTKESKEASIGLIVVEWPKFVLQEGFKPSYTVVFCVNAREILFIFVDISHTVFQLVRNL